MRRAGFSTVIGLVLLAFGDGSVHAAPIPRTDDDLKGLTLGMSIPDFTALFEGNKIPSDERGVRKLEVSNNMLPQAMSRVLCEFVDNKLAYVEATYTPVFVSSHPWTKLVALTTEKLGTPKEWTEASTVNVSQTATLSDSALWQDPSTVFAYGRTPGNGYVLVIADASRFSVVAASLQAREKARKDAEQRDGQQREQARAEKEKNAADEGAKATAGREFEEAVKGIMKEIITGNASTVRIAARKTQRAIANARSLHAFTANDEDQIPEFEGWLTKVLEKVNDKKSTILANVSWQDTGVKVDSDMSVIVHMDETQTWSVSESWGTCGPAGYPPASEDSSGYRMWSNWQTGALVCGTDPEGKIGTLTNKDGTKIDVQAGNAFRCRINDTDLSNNYGNMSLAVLAYPDLPAIFAKK